MNSQHRLELINNTYYIYLCLLILHAYFSSKSSKIKPSIRKLSGTNDLEPQSLNLAA